MILALGDLDPKSILVSVSFLNESGFWQIELLREGASPQGGGTYMIDYIPYEEKYHRLTYRVFGLVVDSHAMLYTLERIRREMRVAARTIKISKIECLVQAMVIIVHYIIDKKKKILVIER